MRRYDAAWQPDVPSGPVCMPLRVPKYAWACGGATWGIGLPLAVFCWTYELGWTNPGSCWDRDFLCLGIEVVSCEAEESMRGRGCEIGVCGLSCKGEGAFLGIALCKIRIKNDLLSC